MIIVVDTNIIISCCLDPNSELYKLVKASAAKIDLVVPEFAFTEIRKHYLHICQKTKKSPASFIQCLNEISSLYW